MCSDKMQEAIPTTLGQIWTGNPGKGRAGILDGGKQLE